jgi:hypothetical protein
MRSGYLYHLLYMMKIKIAQFIKQGPQSSANLAPVVYRKIFNNC